MTETPSDAAKSPGGTVGHPSLAELRERVEALLPTLRERSAHCEELRRIPDETIKDFKANEFHTTSVPERFGGMGYGVDTIAELAMEFGRGCCSTAWMAGQWPGHNFMVGTLPLEVQEEYWANGPDTLSSTASAIARMDSRPEGDGLRVSCHMRFSSGCDAAEWILLMTPSHMTLVPRSDFQVLDDWYVMGLRGTGSKSIIIDEAFIPKHRMVALEDIGMCNTAGATLYPGNPFYRAPFQLVLNSLLLASTIGMARGLLEIFSERALSRTDLHTGEKAFQRPGTQIRFAEASAEVNAAVLIERQLLRDLSDQGRSGELMSLEHRVSLRRDVGFATKLCVQAADRLLESGDASGMYDNSPLQRWARDIHMAVLQYVLTFDEPALSYSRVHWGLEPSSRVS